MPAATGPIAKEFAKVFTLEQRSLASKFFKLLQSGGNPARLNAPAIVTAITVVSGTNEVVVLFGCGYFEGSITTTSPLNVKLLALSKEGDSNIGPPEVHILPTNFNSKREVLSPGE